MWKLSYLTGSLVLALLLGTVSGPGRVFAAHPTVDLLSAENFAVLAGADVNDTNPSAVIGDVGLSPATGAQIDVTCAEVTGTIYSVDAAGPLPCRVENAALLTTAKNDLTTAYNDAAGRPASTIGVELAGITLLDGTFVSDAGTFEISASGTLTLDAQGDANAVFIFQMESTLTTFAGSQVVLVNEATACNVFWQVGSSAVLGTGTNFVGTIMADQSITDDGGSTVSGRFLARIAAVTLNNTTITRPICIQGQPTNTPTATATNTATATATNTLGPDESTATATATNTLGPDESTATNTPVSGATNTPVPPATNTLVPVPPATSTATAPAVVGLPQTGGAPLQRGELAWVLLLAMGALAAGWRALVRRRLR